MPSSLDQLRALERQVEREWWWLNGALHAVAQARAEQTGGALRSFREMQQQMRNVDQRRIEIALQIASLVGRANAD